RDRATARRRRHRGPRRRPSGCRHVGRGRRGERLRGPHRRQRPATASGGQRDRLLHGLGRRPVRRRRSPGRPPLSREVVRPPRQDHPSRRMGWEVVTTATTIPEEDLRERALTSLRKKRDFWSHLVLYLVMNAFFVGIWAMTGSGYFWPM